MPIDIITSAAPLLARYDVLFCDIWGVLHDGRRAFDSANDALARFRANGGTVVLVSNAPNPAAPVARVLDDRGVQRSGWDEIVSSGDIALRLIRERGWQRVHGIGPLKRDHHFFDALPGPVVPIAQAEAIACTGLLDDRRETPEDYRAVLETAVARNLPFVCANPDLHVHVGEHLLPCAGALGVLYEAIGGEVHWTGKPRPSAYATAFEVAARLRGATVPPSRVLAIGDSVRTDLAAAQGAGVDALFITTGIHRDDVMDGERIDGQRLERLLHSNAPPAIAAASALRW